MNVAAAQLLNTSARGSTIVTAIPNAQGDESQWELNG